MDEFKAIEGQVWYSVWDQLWVRMFEIVSTQYSDQIWLPLYKSVSDEIMPQKFHIVNYIQYQRYHNYDE